MSNLIRNNNLKFIIGGCIFIIVGVLTLNWLSLGLDIPELLRPGWNLTVSNLTLTVFAYGLITVGIIAIVIGLIRKSKSKGKPEN